MTLPTSSMTNLAISQIVQVTLVAMAVGLAIRLFCRHRPHLAYSLWLLVLVKCLTPPLWSSPTGLFSWAQLRIEPPHVVMASESPPSVPLDEFGMARHAAETTTDDEIAATLVVSVASVFFVVWLCGACVLGGVVLRKWLRVWRIVRFAMPATDSVNSLAADLGTRLAMRRNVRILVTKQPLSPAVFGLCRPVVIVPELLLRDRSNTDLELIVAHELVHIRRHDNLVAAAQVIVQVLWWFHPLVWWANRQITRERERSCDEEVVAGIEISPARYANSLLGVLQFGTRLRGIFALPGVHPMEITINRLEHIMKRSRRFHKKTPRWCWLVLMTAGVLLLPGAGVTLEQSGASTVEFPADDRKDKIVDQDGTAERTALEATITQNDDGEVVEVSVVNRPISERDLVSLGELNWSKSRSTRTHAGFLELALPALELKSSEISDPTLVHLSGLTQLRTLTLVGNEKITGSGLVHLKGMTNLEQLLLNRTQVGDASLKHIEGLANLRELQLRGTQIKDDGLIHLMGLSRLERLDLGNLTTSSVGLGHLKGIKSLKWLNLSGTRVTDAGLEHLKWSTHLEEILLRDTEITDAGLVHLKGLTSLTGLNLWGTKVTDAGLKHLLGHNLKWLLVNSTPITDTGLAHLRELKQLKHVDLRNTAVTEEGVEDLRKALPECRIQFP